MGLLRPDLGPVLPGEGGERGQVRLGVDQHLGDLGEGVPQSVDDVLVLGRHRLPAGLGEDGRDERVDRLGSGRAQPGGDAAGEVDPAALPGGPGKDRPDRGPDAGVRVTGDQDHTLGVVGGGDLEPPLAQGPQDKDVQKSTVSASPRAMPRISRRPSADTPVATTSARQTTRCPTLTSRYVASTNR